MNPKTTRLSISLFILFTFLLSSLPQARADIISLLKTLEKKQNKGVSADKPKMAPSTSSGQADPEKKPLKDKPFKEELKPTTADKAEPINVLSEFQWSSKLRAKKGFLDQLQYAGQNNSSPLIEDTLVSAGMVGLDPTHPSVAYDTANQRYLIVWEEETAPGVFNIMGQLRNRDGTALGNPVQISTERPTQGCFYVGMASGTAVGAFTVPTSCPHAKSPSVAYNNGKYLVAWELQGQAAFPASDPENRFSNIIAKIISAENLQPVSSEWNEGLMINRLFIGSNDSNRVSMNSQIRSWARAVSPSVAPKLSSDGFVVTWQTNRDYLACNDSASRAMNSINARYIDQNFSSTTPANNKPLIGSLPNRSVYADPFTMATTTPDCGAYLHEITSAKKPRIAYNSAQDDFVVAFELTRGGAPVKSDIGAKLITFNSNNDATVNNPTQAQMMVQAPEGIYFQNPDVISFHNDVILAYDDTNNISLVRLNTSPGEVTTSSGVISQFLVGAENKTEPRIGSNCGIGGTPSTPVTPEALMVTYVQNGILKGVVMDANMMMTRSAFDISTPATTTNHLAQVASDFRNFLVVWAGTPTGMTIENVHAKRVLTTPAPANNMPPRAPTLAAQPANNAIWAPTRLYLSWMPAMDPNLGDTVTYDVYFANGTNPGTTPYRSGITNTHFVIQSSTDGREAYSPNSGVTPIYLSPNQTYTWKICATDNWETNSCSSPRTFRTDDSVVGWWRFDEDPMMGQTCAGGQSGETVCDYSGKNNHGVPRGNPMWLQAPNADLLGGVLEFDGTDDWVEVAHSGTLALNASFSMSCKINPLLTPDIVPILFKDNPTPGPGLNQLGGTTLVFQIHTTTKWNDVRGDITNLLNNNFRGTGTFDGTSIKLFLNESLQNQTPINERLFLNSNPIKMGHVPHLNSYYHGLIDECFVLNKSVSGEEVINNSKSDGS